MKHAETLLFLPVHAACALARLALDHGPALLVGFLLSLAGCGTIEKIATRDNANGARAALRQVCADIAEADRLAAGVLDADGGAP